jgi:hypothetical protein
MDKECTKKFLILHLAKQLKILVTSQHVQNVHNVQYVPYIDLFPIPSSSLHLLTYLIFVIGINYTSDFLTSAQNLMNKGSLNIFSSKYVFYCGASKT